MSHALQVNFRHLNPSESLIALAAESYGRIRQVLQGPGECLVSLEAQEHVKRPLAHASVLVHADGKPCAEASASHRDPHVALSVALSEVQHQLGLFGVASEFASNVA